MCNFSRIKKEHSYTTIVHDANVSTSIIEKENFSNFSFFSEGFFEKKNMFTNTKFYLKKQYVFPFSYYITYCIGKLNTRFRFSFLILFLKYRIPKRYIIFVKN